MDNLNELFNSEKLLRKKTCEKAFAISKEISTAHTQVSQVQQYEEEIDEIKESTNCNDSGELLNQFREAGDQNNWLQGYVKEVKKEVDILDVEISEIKEEIKKYKSMSSDNNREKIVEKLSNELRDTESETKRYKQQLEDTIDMINVLKIGIKTIYDRMGCQDELLSQHGVTESNMMQYLGIIE
jgi:hypothetical protein